MAVAPAGHMQVCTSLQTDNHASTHPTTEFLQARCPSCCPTNSVKALKALDWFIILIYYITYMHYGRFLCVKRMQDRGKQGENGWKRQKELLEISQKRLDLMKKFCWHQVLDWKKHTRTSNNCKLHNAQMTTRLTLADNNRRRRQD